MTLMQNQYASQLGRQLRRAGLAATILTALSFSPAPAQMAAPVIPDGYQLSLLIYATLTALDQANIFSLAISCVGTRAAQGLVIEFK